MYFNFSSKSDAWRHFFYRYSDRILYGTDIYNWKSDGLSTEKRYSHSVNLVRSFLERKEPFFCKWMQKEISNPFGLDESVLDKIYRTNFLRVFGEERRRLDGEFIAKEGTAFLNRYPLNEIETADMKQIINFFNN